MEAIAAYRAEHDGFEYDGKILQSVEKDAQKRPIITSVDSSPGGAELSELVKTSAYKTGTTICGCIAKDCIVLAADTRSTMGSLVADKHCFKLHRLSCNIWCAGAGVAADLDHMTATLAAELQIFTKQLGTLPRVETCVVRLCNKLFQYQGHLTTALIIGGVNPTGDMSLWYVSPDGYSHNLPYMAMGSGGYFAQGILEAHYEVNMDKEAAKNLCADAIEAGVMNDLGSGTGVDLVVLSLEDPENPVLTRSFRTPVAHQKLAYSRPSMPPGQAVILKEIRKPIRPFNADEISDFL